MSGHAHAGPAVASMGTHGHVSNTQACGRGPGCRYAGPPPVCCVQEIPMDDTHAHGRTPAILSTPLGCLLLWQLTLTTACQS